LAIDKEGTLTVIELKRDISGKNVELQALKYAAYCSTLTFEDLIKINQDYLHQKGIKKTCEDVKKSILSFIINDEFEEFSDKPRIILVAKDFSPEVTASVLWLRKFMINISCVKFRPFEFDSNTIIFESSIIIPLPEAEDYIIKAEKKENVENEKTRTQDEYLTFYNSLRELLKDKINIQLSEPIKKSYYAIPTGIGSVHFEFGFHGRPRGSFGVELHFEKGNKSVNLQFLEKLKKYSEQIEKETKEKVIYQPSWGTTWSRIYIQKLGGQMTEELKDWAVEKMLIFIKILQPELIKIKENGI